MVLLMLLDIKVSEDKISELLQYMKKNSKIEELTEVT